MLTASGADTYIWLPSTGLNTSLGKVVIAQPSTTTTYTVVGTYTATGCTTSATAVVNVNALPPLSINASSLSICSGKSASLTASGANIYSWQGGTTPTSGAVVTASPLTNTTYTVTGTNSTTGCSQTATQNIIINPLPTASVTNIKHVSCKGFSDACITSTAAGGASPYTYSWNNGALGSSACGFAAGNYTLTVTDANGCSRNNTVATISEPTLLSATISGSVTHVNCKNACNGSATVSSSGGTAPYTYSWSNGTTTSSASGLCAGTYSVIVRDQNSCTAVVTIVTITEPAVLDLSAISATNSNCNQSTGSVSITASGGTAPYTYNWLPGNYNTSAVSNLPAGNYEVKAQDSKGCTALNNVLINNFNAPIVSLDSAKIIHPSCFSSTNGQLIVNVTGGVSPYKYIWTNATTQDTTISSSTTHTITNIKANTYFITVIDKNNCQGFLNGSITLTQPDSLVANIGSGFITHVACNGASTGKATVTATGGTKAYAYIWSPIGSVTSEVSNLSANNYSVTVTDSKGCTATASVTITQPNSPLASSTTSQQNVNCNAGTDGSASVSVSGGNPGYLYSWSSVGSNTSYANNLKAGTYTVTITDANNRTLQQYITITEPLPLIAGVDSSKTVKITCSNGNDGCLTVTVSGGTPIYQYGWSNGKSTSQICNLSAGDYTVAVTDAHGCTAKVPSGVSTILINPTPVPTTITSSTNGSVCAGQSTILTASGPNIVSYLWMPGAKITPSITVTPTTTTTYSVTSTDNKGCTGTQTATVTVKPIPTIDPNTAVIDTAKCWEANGQIKGVVISGGSSPYSYLWKDGTGKIVGTSKDLINVVPGNYKLYVTDANGCTDSTKNTLNIPSIAGVVASFDATPGGGNIPLIVQFIDKSSPNVIKYNWDFGNDSSSTLKNPKTTFIFKGDYMVRLIVEGPSGCKDTAMLNIRASAKSKIAVVPNIFTPNGDDENDVFKLKVENVQFLHGEIFNRWGQKIFTWDGAGGGWDGSSLSGVDAPDGTYYFIINIIGMDGEKYEEVGYLQLVR